jgi:hypothetical protein
LMKLFSRMNLLHTREIHHSDAINHADETWLHGWC